MARRRYLLSAGNGKLGEAVAHFDTPALLTCPGRTPACSSACYATRARFRFPAVAARLAWCFRQSLLPGFARRLAREARLRGFMHLRWHTSGDVYSAAYARKMIRVMRALPRVTFWLYTRSWAVPDILPLLGGMAGLPNCSVWFSLDGSSPPLAAVPPGVRTCYLQDADGPVPEADLLFRTRRALALPVLGLPPLCPSDSPAGRAAGVNCGSCQRCFT